MRFFRTVLALVLEFVLSVVLVPALALAMMYGVLQWAQSVQPAPTTPPAVTTVRPPTP